MNLSSFIREKKWFLGAILTYAALRIFSYVFPPESLINTAVSAFVILTSVYFIVRKHTAGWIIVATELVLGGTGGYLSVGFLSARTLFLPTSLIAYAMAYRTELVEISKKERRTLAVLALFLACAGLAAVRGILNHHPVRLVIADAIPYLFALYYFPLRTVMGDEGLKYVLRQIIFAAILGNAAFTIGTFAVYSVGWHVLQDHYYHWYRDIAGGKITDLGFHFYRTVLNEHLLLTPVLVVGLGSLMPNNGNKNKRLYFYAGAALLIILAVNLTRIYYLALTLAIALLFSIRHFRRWLAYSAVALSILFGSFVAIHTLASRGQSLGLELFGLRLQSIASPSIEDSSLSRMLLLPNILQKIKKNPLFGSGLGDQVTVYSPVIKQTVTTPQFDWGYFEMVSEFGLIGLAGWTALAGYLLHALWTIRSSPFARPLFASAAALGVINLTSPGLFHVLGVLWLTICLAISEDIKKRPADGPFPSATV